VWSGLVFRLLGTSTNRLFSIPSTATHFVLLVVYTRLACKPAISQQPWKSIQLHQTKKDNLADSLSLHPQYLLGPGTLEGLSRPFYSLAAVLQQCENASREAASTSDKSSLVVGATFVLQQCTYFRLFYIIPLSQCLENRIKASPTPPLWRGVSHRQTYICSSPPGADPKPCGVSRAMLTLLVHSKRSQVA
jgi:hypothetical protein